MEKRSLYKKAVFRHIKKTRGAMDGEAHLSVAVKGPADFCRHFGFCRCDGGVTVRGKRLAVRKRPPRPG